MTYSLRSIAALARVDVVFMKIDKNLAVILILCFAALLILGYVASKGYLNEAQNNATINGSQTQNATNPNQTAGQTPEGNATNQTPAPSGNITNGSTNETPGANMTNLTANITNLSYGPGTGITPLHPKNVTNQTNMTCSDTEASGECYFVAGTTTGSFNGTQGSYSDYCVGNVLHYYMCTYPSAGPVVNGTYICPINCSSGACATQTNTTNCTDSDNGFNLYLRGNTNTSSGNISSDYCINSSILMEYYCLNDMADGVEYICPTGCSNGACTFINMSNIYESDFMVVDDSMPNLLTNQKFFEMPPPPEDNT